MRMGKIASAIILASFIFIGAGCDRGDEKAGYPGANKAPAPATQKNQKPSPSPLAQPPIKAPAGPVGELSAAFCKASIAANASAQASLFDAEFLVRNGIGAGNPAKIDDASIKEMIAITPAEIEKDIKVSRVTPVKECEIITAEIYKPLVVNNAVTKTGCEIASEDAVSRSMEKTDAINISATMKEMKVAECGLIELREISNSGIEIERFIAGNSGGKWLILLGVKTD